MLRRAALALILIPTFAGCDEAPEASSTGEAPRPGGKADGAAPVSEIRFDADFAPPVPTPALIAGGSIAVDYDAQRFFDVYDGSSSLGWFASSFHCYGYGCCEARFPEVDAHHRFDGGEVITQSLDDGSASFEVPADASSLELWFSAPGFELRTWYCGCDAACAQLNRDAAQFRWVEREAWDSHYEQNYDFEVGGWPVVHGEDVKLIEARITDGVLTGEIEVRDLAWHKQVRLHWTVVGEAGEWRESDAAFAGMSEAGEFERWSFAIDDAAIAGAELRFAVRYDVDGRTLWDNDCGGDYSLAAAGDVAVGRACG